MLRGTISKGFPLSSGLQEQLNATVAKCSGVEAKVKGEATWGEGFPEKKGYEHKGGRQMQTLLPYVGEMLLRSLDEHTNMFQV